MKKFLFAVAVFLIGISMVTIGCAMNKSSDEKTQNTSNQTGKESASVSKTANTSDNTGKQSAKKAETTPANIEDVDYKEFYNNYSDDKKGKWVRISGKVSSINGNKDRITIRKGLSGFDHITIKLKQKRDDVKEGNYVTIVGKVGSKVLACVYLEEGYVEALGDEAKSNAKDYIQVDYKELYRDYKENAIAADEKYKDKLIQVTGKIDDIFREVMGHPYVTFEVDKYFGHVQAVFDKDEEKNIAKLKKGQTITVRGRCKGKTINVLLDDCIIIKKQITDKKTKIQTKC